MPGWEPGKRNASGCDLKQVVSSDRQLASELSCGFCEAKEAKRCRRKFFNKKQVTCVGARVSDFAINESDHALIVIVIRSKVQLSARSIR